MAISIGRAVAVFHRVNDISYISEFGSFKKGGNSNTSNGDNTSTNLLKLPKKQCSCLLKVKSNNDNKNSPLNTQTEEKKEQNQQQQQSRSISCSSDCSEKLAHNYYQNLTEKQISKKNNSKDSRLQQVGRNQTLLFNKKARKNNKKNKCKNNSIATTDKDSEIIIRQNIKKETPNKKSINSFEKKIELAQEAVIMNDIIKNGINGMRRSDSTNTLEETLDIGSDRNILTEERRRQESPVYHTNPLKKSFSEDTVTHHVIDQDIPLTPPAKIKSRSRLSSAFRSLRGTKSSRKKSASGGDPTEGGLITSGEEIDIDPTKSDDKDKQKKKTKLSKKFSLNIKKYRTTAKKSGNTSGGENQEQQQQQLTVATSDNLSSTSQTTTTALQYHPLSDLGFSSSKQINLRHGGSEILNVSQVSLINLPASENDTDNDNNVGEYFKEKDKKNILRNQNIVNRDDVNFVITGNSGIRNNNNSELKRQPNVFNEPESPLKFEKVRKIQITIQGKKIERINTIRDKLPTATTSISGEEDYLTATEVDHTTKRTSSLSPSVTGSSRNLILSEQQAHSISPPSNKRQSRRKTKSSLKSSAKDQPEIIKDQSSQKPEKLVITQSTRDTPPAERAPPKPTPPEGNSPDLNKGAIRKTFTQQLPQKSIRDISPSEQLMRNRSKSPFLERGRRYPRGPRPLEDELLLAEKTALLSKSPKTGNNLQNPNLSGAFGVAESSEQITFDIQNFPPLPPTPPTPTTPTQGTQFFQGIIIGDGDNNKNKPIEFSVGKIVRSQPVSQLNISDSQQPDSILIQSPQVSGISRRNNKLLEDRTQKYHSESEYYSDEDKREIFEDNNIINRESYLSGISEYSLDSELITIQHQHQEELVVMPAFGDLTMENEVAPIMTSSGDKREHLYKILIIGELGTGKTSFIKRYVHKFFSQNYRATIGVDFALKVLHWDQSTIIRLQLWDIAGQERFGNMTRVYYKDAVGAFIVFDVTRSGTFECVSKWKEDLDSKVQLPDGSPIPCILLANKCDQEKQGVVTNPDKMDEYVRENGFAGWFETSAKENINIDEAARALVNKILLNDKLITAGDLDADKIALAGSSGYGSLSGKKKECSC